ncbi:hypothetical protein [Alkalilimnicola ehrlichii]|uniref:hypothetical protein n=1 Tax=Alkalilimnicola ehrlichii TaxID=351052 RepID=UPI001C6F1AA3|nr:hypothetical protein [Alkalilimnicola ehrlichii]
MKPDSWHERTASQKQPQAAHDICAVSPERFSASRWFETGFTVQIARLTSAWQRSAQEYAAGYLAPFVMGLPDKDMLRFTTGSSEAGIETIICRFRDAPKGMKPVIVHKFIMTHESSRSMWAFTFEAPAKRWEREWERFGTPILQQVCVFPTLEPSLRPQH